MRRSRRGMVLLAVLIVITLAALMGSTMLLTVDAERSSAETTLRRTQSRALAWSGVQLVMAELSSKREDMLAGKDFEIQTEWTLFDDELGRAAVVRLVPVAGRRDETDVAGLGSGWSAVPGSVGQASNAVGPGGIGGGSSASDLFVSETAKIDINTATKEMLAKVPGIGTEERAQKIIDARPFTSVEELVRVEGFAADLLYGFADTPDALKIGSASAESSVDAEGIETPVAAEGGALPGDEPLIDLLTVFSFDPNVQAGVQDPNKRGKLRVNLNVPWSDRLSRAIEDQWGPDVVPVAERIFKNGMQFRSDGELIRNLLQMGASDPESVRGVLDAVTTSDDMYRLGRIDILRASPTVLATLPGIDLARAYQIADARERLSAEDRLSPMWLVSEGILSLEEFSVVVDAVTTRSLQWRVRVEAGFRPAGAIADVAGVGKSVIEGLESAQSSDQPLEDRVMYDAVIDVASERPRVAYLRDVSMLDLAERMRREDVVRQASSASSGYEDELMSELGLEASGEPASPGEESEGGGDNPSWRSGSRIDERRAQRAAERSARRERQSHLSDVGDEAVSEDESAASGDEAPSVGAEEEQPKPQAMPEPVDRRIGRWRSGGGS